MSIWDSLFGGGEKAAAKEQAESAERAMQERRAAERRARQDFRPYLESGERALPQYEGMAKEMVDSPGFLESLLGQYKPSASYENRFNQGNRAINQAMGSNGMYGSGDLLKSLMEYGQNLASEDEQRYLENVLGIRGNAMNAFGAIANQGYNSAANIGNITANTGQGLAEDQNRYGEARANERRASSNILTNILGTAGRALTGGISGAMGGGGFGGFGSGFGQGLRRGFNIYGHGLGDY